MVDPTKGIGPYQSLISGSRTSDSTASRQTTPKEVSSSGKTDEVTLSPKALSVSQAEETTTKLRSLLSSDTSQSLSSGSHFDESL